MLKPKSAARPSNFFTAFCAAALDEHAAETYTQRVAGCELSRAAVAAVAKLLAGHLLVFRFHRGPIQTSLLRFPVEQGCSIENGSAVTRQGV